MLSQGKQITHFNTRDLRGFLLRFLLSLSLSALLTFLFEHYASYFKSIRFGTLLWLTCTILYLKNYRYHYKKIS